MISIRTKVAIVHYTICQVVNNVASKAFVLELPLFTILAVKW